MASPAGSIAKALARVMGRKWCALQTWTACDFADVRGAPEALWALCAHRAPGEIVNACSGQPTPMRNLMLRMVNVLQIDVTAETDPTRLRGDADVSSMYGSSQRLFRHRGGTARISAKDGVRRLLA